MHVCAFVGSCMIRQRMLYMCVFVYVRVYLSIYIYISPFVSVSICYVSSCDV